MKQIRYLTIYFDTPLKPFEVPAFRGAIIERAGRENILFHNHIDENYLYGYPVMQYKVIRNKAAIVCLDYGADEIHRLFEKKVHSIKIGEEQRTMNIDRLQMNQFTMNVWQKSFDYTIYNWIALSQKNHKEFDSLKNNLEREAFLEKVLIGNILSMAKGIKWNIESPIQVKIRELVTSKKVTHKEAKLLAFQVRFSTNVFLPNHIGLGKAVSFGFGTIYSEKKNNA